MVDGGDEPRSAALFLSPSLSNKHYTRILTVTGEDSSVLSKPVSAQYPGSSRSSGEQRVTPVSALPGFAYDGPFRQFLVKKTAGRESS